MTMLPRLPRLPVLPRVAMRVAAVVLAVLLLAAGCGLSRDNEPRLVALDELPESIRPGQRPTPTVVQQPGTTTDTQVFMIDGNQNRLVGVNRKFVTTPEELIEILLLDATQEEVLANIDSAINRGTEVQDINVNELFQLATVDLAPGSLDPRRTEQRLAFAQIVYSLTSLPDINEVTFVQTDPDNPERGQTTLPVQTDTGTTLPGQRVSRQDFTMLWPNIDPRPPLIQFDGAVEPTPDPSLRPLLVWKVNEFNQLVSVERNLEPTPESVLVGLIDGTVADEEEQNIRSAIPPDALADDIETIAVVSRTTGVEGSTIIETQNIAMIDLLEGSLPRTDAGDELLLAVAQIVYTMTELPEIDQVAFSVEGTPISVPTQLGPSAAFDPTDPKGLSRADYNSLLPSDSPQPTPAVITEPTPTPTPG